jgi:uncharacterized protein
MARTIFVNIAVGNVARAAAFYEAIGFVKDARFSDDHATSMRWSDAIVIGLLDKAFFATLTPKAVADPRQVAHVLIALSMDSPAEVDAIVEKAIAAGGTADASPPEDLGFMYSRDFADPDGNAFGPFFMDETALPTGGQAQSAA